jgi:hypothetical protein
MRPRVKCFILGEVFLKWANTASSGIRQLAPNFPALKRAYSGIAHFANMWGFGRLADEMQRNPALTQVVFKLAKAQFPN